MNKHIALAFALTVTLASAGDKPNVAKVLAGDYHWSASAPLVQAQDRDGDRYHAIKDPSVVFYQGRYHIFCTLRGKQRSHQIEYLSFRDWSQANQGRRETLRLTSGFFCAPQVFYFRPHKKWYLIYQIADESFHPPLQPAFSTTSDISNPASWTAPQRLFTAPGVKNWIDFWVICDDRQAHLFFTTLNGKMWRSDAALNAFPGGWNEPRVVIEGDIFEASHTYALKGQNKFLTFVEAQAPQGRRYFKAYLADRLDGDWKPIATSLDKAFAAPANVRFSGQPWTDSFSHGEFLRDGCDERLLVDPARLRLVFQGVLDRDKQGKSYGEIPWQLGLLTFE